MDEPKKRRGNPNWVKGQSGNPNGRVANSVTHMGCLEQALRKVSEEKRIPFWEHVMQQAYADNKVLVAVMNKLVPNLEKTDNLHKHIPVTLVFCDD